MNRVEENIVIYNALSILENRLRQHEVKVESPDDVRSFLILQLAQEKREVFCVMFLSAKHNLIEFETMFQGTLTQASVYPREVVKRALELNAASVIFAHNHPSGIAESSKADEVLTQSLKSALSLIDVKTLDHFIVGHNDVMSFAEHGLI
jgi:DNA repair protein RadC